MASRAASRMDRGPHLKVDPNAAWPIRDQAWLVLTEYVSDRFPQGTFVLITEHIALPESPSSTLVDERRKNNTDYHFKKIDIVTSITVVATDPSAGGGVTPNLLRPVKGASNATLEVGQLVQLIGRIPPVRVEGAAKPMEVPINTIGRIKCPMSSAGQDKTLSSVYRPSTTRRWVLQFAFKITKHQDITSGAARGSGAFRAPTESELAAHLQRYRAQPVGVVIGSMAEVSR
ncbi:hypothetical protein ONZ51_g10235 [Trametes cubensis]|uniref:Uncharacterized protein n=1 Tax=Trametes cubensis TaxID=1111947 RepID=A0AAD7TLR1_9APHY|nr:hypothetical protein ONZ51_g10235 [Trametes cubensis]